jgi:ATP-binding cassette subfamily F protein uup
MHSYKIAVIAGDGIGKEVMPEGIRVLDAAGRKFGIEFTFDEFDWSCDNYEKHGWWMPPDWRARIGEHDSIFFGATGWPAIVPDHKSLWDSLTLDPSMAVSGASDQVMVRGSPRHVVGYLKDFLFDERQARAPVRSLSGGEKARLLLARLMAKESNLLVLDEPTNDLDVETLDLLQDLLGEYPGTVLLVSHDRDFIDRVASTTVAMEGDGRATVYAGGWSDYRAQRGEAAPVAAPRPAKDKPVEPAAKPKPAAKSGLSYTEKHRLEELPAVIERLEAEIGKLNQLLSDPELFTREPVKFRKATEALAERQEKLGAAEEEWLTLEEKAGG